VAFFLLTQGSTEDLALEANAKKTMTDIGGSESDNKMIASSETQLKVVLKNT